jgi:hypothetical protein
MNDDLHASGQKPVIRMGDVLTMAPQSDALNDDVLGRLLAGWSHVPAVEIAKMGVFHLARELTVTLPDNEGFGNELRLKVAEEIMKLLSRFGIEAESDQPPLLTTVRIERNYDEMSLRQLLETIIADPDVYPNAVRCIRTHRELRPVVSKTHKWVVPVNDTGEIDLEATLRYVTQLSKPHSTVQRIVEGRRPISLDHAMGVNDQPLIHPVTGRLVQGPDDNGFDWSSLDRELLEAVIWARKTGHRRLPDLESDVFGWSEQLFQDPLPRRFRDILDDYRNARRERVSTVDGIRADWPEDLPHDDIYTFFAATAVAVDYEALVRQAARLAAPYRGTGMGITVSGGVYTTVNLSGMSAYLNGPVVLDGGTIKGMGASGTVYMPPGRSVSVSGMGAHVQVVNQTWKQLAERLGLV